jgi:hypothetical protein
MRSEAGYGSASPSAQISTVNRRLAMSDVLGPQKFQHLKYLSALLDDRAFIVENVDELHLASQGISRVASGNLFKDAR